MASVNKVILIGNRAQDDPTAVAEGWTRADEVLREGSSSVATPGFVLGAAAVDLGGKLNTHIGTG